MTKRAEKLMVLDQFQSEIVLSFYEAAEALEQWTSSAKKISQLLNGAGINFWRFDHVNKTVEQKCDYGYDVSSSSILYETDIIIQCKTFQAMVDLPDSNLYHWSDITKYETLMNSILWNEWVSKTRTFPHTTARLPLSDRVSYQLNTAYFNNFKPFDDRERVFWNNLVLPHLWQALRLEHRIFGSETKDNIGFDVLDQLSAAVVLLSDEGAILDANRSANRILSHLDGVSLHQKRLICANRNEHRELNHLIGEAVQTGRGKVGGAGGFMTVTRPSLKRPYHVAIYPLLNGQKYSSGSNPARVLVLIDDPEERPEAPVHVLQRLYGISHAQSKVMILLLRGLKQVQIAEELCLSKNTIKSHEREIFERLDVRSRSDLIRLVLPSLGSLQL